MDAYAFAGFGNQYDGHTVIDIEPLKNIKHLAKLAEAIISEGAESGQATPSITDAFPVRDGIGYFCRLPDEEQGVYLFGFNLLGYYDDGFIEKVRAGIRKIVDRIDGEDDAVLEDNEVMEEMYVTAVKKLLAELG